MLRCLTQNEVSETLCLTRGFSSQFLHKSTSDPFYHAHTRAYGRATGRASQTQGRAWAPGLCMLSLSRGCRGKGASTTFRMAMRCFPRERRCNCDGNGGKTQQKKNVKRSLWLQLQLPSCLTHHPCGSCDSPGLSLTFHQQCQRQPSPSPLQTQGFAVMANSIISFPYLWIWPHILDASLVQNRPKILPGNLT